MSALSALNMNTGQTAISALTTGVGATGAKQPPVNVKTRAAAVDFEAVFLNQMFGQMFSGISGEGPMGGSGATGVWRSFLTDEYAKSFAKAGGIGIADQVYRQLLAHQEAHAS